MTVPLISVFLPIVTRNPLNLRDHWSARAKRSKAHRFAAKMAVMSTGLCDGNRERDVLVMLTRYGRKMDDDGLVASMKAIRDGIADALGIDDGESCVKYECAQVNVSPSKKKEHGVRVEIFEVSP